MQPLIIMTRAILSLGVLYRNISLYRAKYRNGCIYKKHEAKNNKALSPKLGSAVVWCTNVYQKQAIRHLSDLTFTLKSIKTYFPPIKKLSEAPFNP